MESKRYFIVFYIAIKGDGRVTGQCGLHTNEGYLSRKGAVNWLKLQDNELADIVFTNIIELSKEDYESWSN